MPLTLKLLNKISIDDNEHLQELVSIFCNVQLSSNITVDTGGLSLAVVVVVDLWS